MIALPDGNIAVSSGNKPHPIVIMDSSTYEVKKEIHLEGINSWSSLYFKESLRGKTAAIYHS